MKSDEEFNKAINVITLNRTILELKLRKAKRAILVGKALNRTILELKLEVSATTITDLRS